MGEECANRNSRHKAPTAKGKQKLGALGESLVRQELEGKGWQVVENNWRTGHLEVDIIAVDPLGRHHLVEVKSRWQDATVAVEELLSPAKIRALISAAHLYAQERPEVTWLQIDLACVLFKGNTPRVLYYPDAVLPTQL